MATTVTLRMRPRSLSGPAVRRHPLPVRSLLLSSAVHAVVVGGIAAAAFLWRPEPTKTYFVNLAPAVPALGSPAGKTTTPAPPAPPPPRAEERPAPPKSPPPDMPTREVAPKTTKATAPEMPPRDVQKPPRPSAPPDLPTRTAAKLPDMPTREVPRDAPRPGAKELPSLAPARPPAPSPSPASPPTSAPARPGPATATRDAGPAPPAPPLGLPTGNAQGVGTVASVDGNFPFQWYLTAVQRKVYEQWTQPLSSAQGQKVVIVFEIARSGEVTAARVEKTSGDAAYDLAALRAVTSANPLPPLPSEYKGSMIRVHFGFDYTGRG
jgi:TonB family protein